MWQVKEYQYQKEKTVGNGNKFLLGNGFMGYRGTIEEDRAEECAGINLAGLYDKYIKEYQKHD
jgi:trehalose/maltose hydrolase-like predicted phosphorylase